MLIYYFLSSALNGSHGHVQDLLVAVLEILLFINKVWSLVMLSAGVEYCKPE